MFIDRNAKRIPRRSEERKSSRAKPLQTPPLLRTARDSFCVPIYKHGTPTGVKTTIELWALVQLV
jgi:hypothetical protein